MKVYLYPVPAPMSPEVATLLGRNLVRTPARDTLKREIHDAGRQGSGFGHERNDCTVRALATAAGIDYAEAHVILALAGRKPGDGIVFSREATNKRFEGFDMVPVPTIRNAYSYGRDRYQTVARALKGPLRKGRFIVLSHNHAFAVVDGVIHDNGVFAVRARTRCVGAFIPVKIKMIGDN